MKLKPSYDEEEERDKIRERVRKIRAKKEKCPVGRKCKDKSCMLHEERDKKRLRSHRSQLAS